MCGGTIGQTKQYETDVKSNTLIQPLNNTLRERETPQTTPGFRHIVSMRGKKARRRKIKKKVYTLRESEALKLTKKAT